MTISKPSIAVGFILRNLLFQAPLLLLMLVIFSGPVSASMKCGTNLISDGRSPGQSKVEVLQKCGKPYSQSGNIWIYVKGRSIYRLRFSDLSGLVSIRREIVR